MPSTAPVPEPVPQAALGDLRVRLHGYRRVAVSPGSGWERGVDGDSPAGLAALIIEKLRSWTDCDGRLETVFTRDELLTWITAYWVSGTIGTSFTPYAEAANAASPAGRIIPPAAFTIFPRDLVNAPREFAARIFNVQSWSDEPAGGHFAAWEQPEAYAAGIRSAVALAQGS